MSNIEGRLELAAGQSGVIRASMVHNSRFAVQIEGAGTVAIGAKMAGAATHSMMDSGLQAGYYSDFHGIMIESIWFKNTHLTESVTIHLAGAD